MPQSVDITVQTDADFYQQFQYMLPDNVTPIPIIAATFVFGVRRSIGDSNTLFRVTSTLSSSGQIQIIDGPNGIFGLWIAQAQIAAAPVGTWSQSMIINQPATSVFPPALAIPIWNGDLTITLGPSR